MLAAATAGLSLCVCVWGGSRELNIGLHAYKYFTDCAISLAPKKFKRMHAYCMHTHMHEHCSFTLNKEPEFNLTINQN